MTDLSSKTPGIALFCNDEGRIRQVLLNDFQLEISDTAMFFSLVDPSSRQKALSFLVEIKSKQFAFDYHLDLIVSGKIKSLYFLGVNLQDNILLVGAENHKEAIEFTDHLQQINNEQANHIRQLLKSKVKEIDVIEKESDQLFGEVSRLNNELINLQRDLHKKNAQLEQLNKLKNRFLGMAAHDLRNPLNIIISYADFIHMEAEQSLSPEHLEFVETIKKSSWSMLALIEDLLDYSKIESGQLQLEFENKDLVEHIRRNVELNQVLATKKKIQVCFDSNTDKLPFSFDGNKLDQVLNNLITNAVKFSDENKTVEVSLSDSVDHVDIQVCDHGLGIPEDRMDNLFKPFEKGQTGTQGEKSTGLGMVIIKRIVEGHNGTITFESEKGIGTSFNIRLPR